MYMIPLHLIETFIIYSENGNLVKTAKTIGQSQPSASRQIEQFQKFFKRRLFLQSGKNKKLTPYGEEVQNYYKESIKSLRQLRENFHTQLISGQKEKLILAARSEILQKYICPLKFNSLIELSSLSGEEIRTKLADCAVDIAVLQENFETFNYFRKKLFTSNWTIAAPKSWNIKSVNDLQPLPFAAYEAALNYLPKARRDLNVKFIANDWRILADKVAQQEYWSILPEEYSSHTKIVSLPAEQMMKETPFYIYFKKDLSKNKDVQYIIDQLS